MDRDKNLEGTEEATREFLEGLSVEKLRVALNSPLAATILEHCAESEKLSLLVQQIFDAEFNEMSPEEQERWEAPIAIPDSSGVRDKTKIIEFPQKTTERSPGRYRLPLAAASPGGEDSAGDEGDVPVRFAVVTIGESTFAFEEDPSSGMVFIVGPVLGGVTHLYVKDEAWQLKPTVNRDRFELVGAGLIKVEKLIDQHEQNPETHPIGFDRRK